MLLTHAPVNDTEYEPRPILFPLLNTLLVASHPVHVYLSVCPVDVPDGIPLAAAAHRALPEASDVRTYPLDAHVGSAIPENDPVPETFAFPESQRFAHLFPVAPISF